MLTDILPVGYLEVDETESYFMMVNGLYVGLHRGHVEELEYATLGVSNGPEAGFDEIIPVDIVASKDRLDELCRRLNFFQPDVTKTSSDQGAAEEFIELFSRLIDRNKIEYARA